MKRVLQKLMLLGFGTLVGLLIAEIGARVFYPDPENFAIIKVGTPPPYIHYVDVAPWADSVTYYKVEGEYETTLSFNGQGIRGPEIPYEKPEGQFRILYVGDSFVEAPPVNFEDTMYQQLEMLLRDLPKQYEIIGAGIGGWGTDQEYLYYLHEGRKYEPDLVIYQFITNDVADNARDTFYPEVKYNQHFALENEKLIMRDIDFDGRQSYQRAVALHRNLYVQSRFYAFGMDLLRGDVEILRQAQPVYTQVDLEPSLRRNQMLYIYQEPYSDKYERAWELTEAIVSEWNAQVKKDGASFAVIYIPSHWVVYDWQEIPAYYPPLADEFPKWNPDKPDEYLHAITQRHDIPFLSLTADSRRFASEDDKRLYGRKDVHWNKTGHAFGAQVIFDWLLEQDWFPDYTAQHPQS